MYFIIYVIVGLIAGWVATEVSSIYNPHQFYSNVIIGTIGSLLGGYIFEILSLANFTIWVAIGMSMVGATLFLILVKLFSRPQRKSSV